MSIACKGRRVVTMMRNCSLLIGVTSVLLLAACSSTPPPSRSPAPANAGRYEMKNDSPVLEALDLSKIKPVIPRVENRTLAGNKSPYTVNGKTYKVLASEAGYSETGVASWYGRKFHGHLTSNGEIYDMFQLSAAHTQLPIPSYARVTNLDNGKSVVVRVNDRGPFHTSRIMDLSYAAATILGYADKGTARIRVEAVLPENGAVVAAVNPVSNEPFALTREVPTVEALANEKQRIDDGEGAEYLQVGAFGNLESAMNLVARLNKMTPMQVFIKTETAENGATLHKVRVGPLASEMQAEQLVNTVRAASLGTPFRVRI